jgi:hypothetical protein
MGCTGAGRLAFSSSLLHRSPERFTDMQQTKSPPAAGGGFVAPHPGSQAMPQWTTADLIDAPRFTLRKWFAMLGPGLLMGGAAIGGGEWLTGPLVTARYGGALLWLATCSILAQVVYNLELCRYTLYSGEPIFTGKFRTLPGPRFWLLVYLVLDFGALFPYLAASAATPVATLLLGYVPNAESPQPLPALGEHFTDVTLLRVLGYVIFLLALVPLVFGGKVYNSLKAVMSFKLVTVFGFLLVLAAFFSTRQTWAEIGRGFLQFGNYPIQRSEDANGNGRLDAGEDWDGDGKLDVVEQKLTFKADADGDGAKELWQDTDGDGLLEAWSRDPQTAAAVAPVDADGDGRGETWPDQDRDSKPDKFVDADGDRIRDGDNVDNVFVALWQGRTLPLVDLSMIATLCAMIAISGQGGLSNTPVSNYTRDQGWGMGHHVGAIPSVIGGHHLALSHVGCVFEVTAESLRRWRRWYRHVMRDQLVIWMPACFIGLALPSMLSVQFLARGTEAEKWTAAGMTAHGVEEAVTGAWGEMWGGIFWFATLFCGFLVLAPTQSTSADGVIRRWVDVFWTALPQLRKLDTKAIRKVYFGVLCGYAVFGVLVLVFVPEEYLLTTSTNIFNWAIGFSCWHTLAVNCTLLPKPLRPGWFVRIALSASGLFFLLVAGLTTHQALLKAGWL